ncbi:MAG: maleylpyruvate isomerase family mycothiol-dependent enzyme [Chloroflexi bacterium]|nr:maleylpyruvate isomerase family mycothiol-dependent enzyme [Chloroflexota bacterium]
MATDAREREQDQNARTGAALERLRDEDRRLEALVESLSPADWDRISTCAPWTVRQLVAHVVRSAESYLTSIERGLQGNLEPAHPRSYRITRMDEIAALPPKQIAADLRAIDERFQREIEALRPDKVETLGIHSHGPRNVRWFTHQRLAEVAFHRWDLERSVERPADFDTATAAELLPMLVEENLPAYIKGEYPRHTGRFRLSVAGGPSWLLDATPGRLAVTADTDASADVTIRGGAASIALLVYGRRTLNDLVSEGGVTADGDERLIGCFGEVLKMP